MYSRFDLKSQAILTHFSIAFYQQPSRYHVYWERNAVRMVNVTICVHHGQHSRAPCHHPGVQKIRLNIFCLTGINKCNGLVSTLLHTFHQYVEIKCQLDETEVFIAVLITCSTCFGHHYAHHQELKSIIQWLLRVVFRAVVFQVSGLVWS